MRFALPAAALLAAAAAAQPPAAPDPKSLVGQTVLTWDGNDPVVSAWSVPPPPDRPPPPGVARVWLRGGAYRVRDQVPGWVRVRDTRGRLYWVQWENVVPLAGAAAFFTPRTAAPLPELAAGAYNARGLAHLLNGDYRKAAADFDDALKLDTRHADARCSRGLALTELGEFDRAEPDLFRALALANGPEMMAFALTNLGYLFEQKGEYGEALDGYEQAVMPDVEPDFALALNNAAWVRATCPDAKYRDAKKAVELATKACTLTGDDDGMYLDTLAAALAEAGRFADAVKAQEKALADPEYAKRYGDGGRERLALYKQGKPFRTAPVKK